ncbi:flagellar biosynthesis protein FlhA [Paraburkholderia ferrariae]|uniref:Flagellar biosynthesis protein FlhA n=1 Tax=Paraburkholderia ferrariae TaxID=386056 RepID=A0ABU9RMH9_9BURK
MNAFGRLFGGSRDIVLVGFVIGVLVVLFMPIPAVALDALILTNFSFAFLVLLLTFYMARPVEFSTFPSLLLVATLFRLSLNVAATRLILSEGDAGRVISAIGSYVVGGNYVIGIIVFLILIVVQYVVVTSGAQRVSEVAARFTLDSMPGQQMSIDADLNMGFIDQAEAQRRRKNLEKEAQFYGAMDGASKFVKGDAIAGILILMIDIVGGLVIGVVQLGMPWVEALQTYTLLTIGDGIVTQAPALVIAVGTGIIVTRSGGDQNLSVEALRQVTAYVKPLVVVGLVLLGLMALPGIPAAPAGTLAFALLAGAWWISRRRAAQSDDEVVPDAEPGGAPDDYALLTVEPIEVQIGLSLAPLANEWNALVGQRIAVFRKQFTTEMGLVLPAVRLKSNPRLNGHAYTIDLFGTTVTRGEVLPERVLAIHPSGEVPPPTGGIETRDPAYGLRAWWIEESQRAKAMAARYTLIDATTVFFTHLTETLRREAGTLLTRAETDRLLARVRQAQPGLVEELIPSVLTVSDVQRILQNLLREKVSVRNLGAILETLVDAGRQQRDVVLLTEIVRQRLGQSICQSLMGDSPALNVLTIEAGIEARLLQALGDGVEKNLSLDPKLAEVVMSRLAQQSEKMLKSNLTPVLLCVPDLRRHLRALSERLIPQLRVVSMGEIPRTIELKAFATVSLNL